MKAVAYIAGPYRAPTRGENLLNISLATIAASHLRREGIACIVPHLESVYGEDALSEHGWEDHGIALLDRCDIMVVYRGPGKHSAGVVKEIEHAEKRAMPILYSCAEAIEFISECEEQNDE